MGARADRGGAAEAAGVQLSHHSLPLFPSLVVHVRCALHNRSAVVPEVACLRGAGIIPLVNAVDCRTPHDSQPCGNMGRCVVMRGDTEGLLSVYFHYVPDVPSDGAPLLVQVLSDANNLHH